MSTLTREDWLAASIGAQDFQRYGCRQPSVPRETLGFSGRLVTWVFGEGMRPGLWLIPGWRLCAGLPVLRAPGIGRAWLW
jgi:hypothetical protein